MQFDPGLEYDHAGSGLAKLNSGVPTIHGGQSTIRVSID